jgi:hypothetical protein
MNILLDEVSSSKFAKNQSVVTFSIQQPILPFFLFGYIETCRVSVRCDAS